MSEDDRGHLHNVSHSPTNIGVNSRGLGTLVLRVSGWSIAEQCCTCPASGSQRVQMSHTRGWSWWSSQTRASGRSSKETPRNGGGHITERGLMGAFRGSTCAWRRAPFASGHLPRASSTLHTTTPTIQITNLSDTYTLYDGCCRLHHRRRPAQTTHCMGGCSFARAHHRHSHSWRGGPFCAPSQVHYFTD